MKVKAFLSSFMLLFVLFVFITPTFCIKIRYNGSITDEPHEINENSVSETSFAKAVHEENTKSEDSENKISKTHTTEDSNTNDFELSQQQQSIQTNHSVEETSVDDTGYLPQLNVKAGIRPKSHGEISNDLSKNTETYERKPEDLAIFNYNPICSLPPKKIDYSWDYKLKGGDWTGLCRDGHQQSPVNLRVEGLDNSSDINNLLDLYLSVQYGNRNEKPQTHEVKFMAGDFLYTYTRFIEKAIIYKTDKEMHLKAVSPVESWGSLFPVDTGEIFTVSHIELHSPSEHTFEGEANQRAVELQVWHYNRHYDQQIEDTPSPDKSFGTLSSVINAHSKQDTSLPGRWKVVSLTFSEHEGSTSEIPDISKLPSEIFINTLVNSPQVDVTERNKQGQAELVEFKAPLDLTALIYSLQLVNFDFFRYNGSATTPPCEENVTWYVARVPLPIATHTLQKFYKMLNPLPPDPQSGYKSEGNFREVQNTKKKHRNQNFVSLVQGYPLHLVIQKYNVFHSFAFPEYGSFTIFIPLFAIIGLFISYF